MEWSGMEWNGMDSLFSQGKPTANGYYTRHPENNIPVLEELMYTAYIQPHYTAYMHAHTWDGV